MVAGGAEDPPTMIVCSLPRLAPLSSTWSIMLSQTVGTPAEWVTPSWLKRAHKRSGLLSAQRTSLKPAIAAAYGMHQLPAWNMGTTGSITERAETSNMSGAITLIAWSTVERCSYRTPFGFPVVPLV